MKHVTLYSELIPYVEIYDHCHMHHAEYSHNAGFNLMRALGIKIVNRHVLELGSGNGELAAALESAGCRVMAVEVSPVAFEKIRCSEKLLGGVHALSLVDRHFDIFIACDVLEHLIENDIRIALTHAARLGDALLVTVSTRPSGLLGPRGENLHATVRPAEWWCDQVKCHFDDVRVTPGPYPKEFVISGRAKTASHLVPEVCIGEHPHAMSIKPGYVSRRVPAIFHDDLVETQNLVHQPDVYPFAAHIARRYGCRHIIDLGCGRGRKLAPLAPEFSIVGVDLPGSVDHCREAYPFGRWIPCDLERAEDLVIEPEVIDNAVIICSDVIEHLWDPRPMLRMLRTLLERAPAAVLSSPERDLVRGIDDMGPPANPHHVREWSQSELVRFLDFIGLHTEFSGLTHNNDRDLKKRTTLAVLGRRQELPQPPPPDFSVAAVMTCFNEADIVEQTVQNLRDQGVDVYIIDNWSTDDSFERAKALMGRGVIGVERFPAEGPTGTYDWERLLRRVAELAHSLPANWVLHHDVDEIRESPWPNVTLRDAIYRVEREGFNAIDHTVINFVPTDNDFTGAQSLRDHFRHFEFGRRPGHFIQVKGWANRGDTIDLASSGGHIAEFPGRRVYPYKFLLRHYPIRSQAHGERKVLLERHARWNSEERRRGWHNHYDKMEPGYLYLRRPEELTLFDDSFYGTFLVERLSGIMREVPQQ